MTDVLVLATYLTRRQAGAAHATINIINGLAAAGWARVRVLAYEVEPGVLRPDVAVQLMAPEHQFRGSWRLAPWPSYRHAQRELRRLVDRPADVAYTHSPVFGSAYRRVFPRARLVSHTGFVLWRREWIEEGGAAGLLHRAQAAYVDRLEGAAYRSANWDQVVSTALVAQQRAEHFGVPVDRFTVCPLPIDAERFDPGRELPNVRAQLGIPADAFVVATATRLVPFKRVGWVLQAAAAAHRPVHVIVVGDGPDRERLEQEARPLADAGRAHFVGWQDPVAYVHAADAFALTSVIESFGMVYAEAMMMGVPCLGRHADPPRVLNAASDVIAEGVTGYCVRSPDELRARIDLLAADPALRARLAANARAVARERFVVGHYVGRLAELLGVAGAPSSPGSPPHA